MPVVASVGIAAPIRSGRAEIIERAMRGALKKAQDEGETRPAVLRAIVLAARTAAQQKFPG